MRCSNCGKEIPFAGNVCPYCHIDKSGDQRTHLLALVGGVGGAIGGGLIFGFWGVLGGLFVGALAATVAGAKMNAKK